MSVAKLAAALVAGTLSFAAVSLAVVPSAMAASPITTAFIANVVPNVDFLDQSSRMALGASPSIVVRNFARTEAAQQTAAAASVDEWVRAERAAQAVLAQMAEQGEPLQSGRSVAVDEPPPPVDAGMLLADTRQPAGAADLQQLQGLSGPAFDSAYRMKQLDALRQIAADYATYIAAGDDPLLLGIAGRELPKVRQQILKLRKL